MIKPWPLSDRKKVGDFRIFSVHSESKTSPRTGAEHDFFVIDTNNWVNVIATTPEGQMILVEQYRHGSNTVELEVPGGVMDTEDDSPLTTAVRELREETGYAGDPPKLIGEIFPNPAIMSNRCYTVLIENCRLQHDTEFDPGEDLITRLVPIDDAARLVAEGKFRHAIVVVALYYFELFRRR